MNTNKKYKRLVELLYSSTVSNKIDWTSDDDGLWSIVAGKKILLRNSHNGDFEPIELIDILNEEGRKIDTFSDEDLGTDAPSVENYQRFWPLMVDLRTTAYNKAVGIDTALDDIIQNLDDDA